MDLRLEPCPEARPLVLPVLRQQYELFNQRVHGFNPEPLELSRLNWRRRDHLYLPKRQFLIRKYGVVADNWDSSCLSHVMQRLRPTRGRRIRSYCDQLETRYRLREETRKAWDEIQDSCLGTSCLIRVEQDSYHAGKSPEEVMGTLRPGEFAFDPYIYYMMMYAAHEAQTPTMNSKSIGFATCSGAQYDFQGKNRWSDATRWEYRRNTWYLDWNFPGRARDDYFNLTGYVVKRSEY